MERFQNTKSTSTSMQLWTRMATVFIFILQESLHITSFILDFTQKVFETDWEFRGRQRVREMLRVISTLRLTDGTIKCRRSGKHLPTSFFWASGEAE